MRVVWTEAAVSDLVALREYLGARNRVAARKMARAIRDAVRLLTQFPAMGRPGRIANTRELVIAGTPYLVPYRVRNEVLEILRVLHGARRWPKRL